MTDQQASQSEDSEAPKKSGAWKWIGSLIGGLLMLGAFLHGVAVDNGTAPSATEALIARKVEMANQGRNCADFSGEARKYCIRRALERDGH